MEKKTNTPALRFRGFDGPWEKKKLDDISMAFNYGLNAAATNYDGRHKYLRITDIDDESRQFIMDNVTSPSINFAVAEEYKLQEGDIVFARTGASVGKTYLYDPLDGDVYYAGYLIRAHIKPEYDPNFVFQNTLTQSYARYIAITSQRSGQPGVNAQEYSAYEIQVPSLAEQCCVGTTLQKLDNVIAKQAQKIKKLEQFRQAMLTKLFPAEGASEPALRFRDCFSPWKTARLGDLGTTYGGLNGKTKKDFGHGAGRFVTYLNIFNNPIADLQGIEAVELDKTQNQVKYGDIFFTTSSETPEEVGMSSVWLGNDENVYLNSFCFGYRPLNNLYPYFMAYLLRSTSIRKKFIFLAQGISRYNISKNRVMDMYIPLPPIEEQKNIGDFLYSLDNFLSLQKEKLDKMRLLKAALLEKLFV